MVGSEAAQKLNLAIGDEFFGSHGSAEEGEVHEHYAYKVVGIISATGKVVDNLIISNIPSVWQMHGSHEEEAHEDEENPVHGEVGHIHEEGDEHEHHEHEITIDEPGMEITSVLLQMRNPMAKLTWQRIIPQNTKMQAASPAIEINRLFTLFGVGIDALRYLAYGIMLISGISIFIALFNTLKERKSYNFV